MNVDYILPVYLTLLPLALILIALIFNTITTLTLLVNRMAKNINCFKYLAVIAIFDTLCLFTWNLNQFLTPNFGIQIENYNIYTCRIFLYMQFTSIQISSLLRSLLCIERFYFVIKFRNLMGNGKNFFGTNKSVKFWITFAIILGAVLNSHFLFNTGSYGERQKTLISDEKSYNTSSVKFKFNCYDSIRALNFKQFWSRVNLITALIIPSALMIIFDFSLVYRTYKSKKRIQLNTMRIINKPKSFTLSLLYISISYLVLQIPANLYFSFFNDYAPSNNDLMSFVIVELDFLPHSILFFELYLTNTKFCNILKQCYETREHEERRKRSQMSNLNHGNILTGRSFSVMNDSRMLIKINKY